jgi:Spy/CpxP family protein refolding chaperone
MSSPRVLALFLAAGAAAAVLAPVPPRAAETPYAGLQERPIKALSADQIADLRASRGMGLALAAELNGWPGPLHALELAGPLALTPAQRARLEALLAAMRAETVPLGERVIAAEASLDRLFATRTVTPEALEAATAASGAALAALRAAHLRYHLAASEVLTAEQSEHYAVLRGYRAGGAGHHRRGH